MEKYKVCPSCKTKNEPTLLECINCEADLTMVKITDEATERMWKENAAAQSAAVVKWVRLCECGAKNPANARKCGFCNEDISDITPVPDKEKEQSAPIYVLSSLDGQYAYKMTADEVTIGRENIMGEYLSAKSYVSRAHAKLILAENELYIENMSNTNFTYVNNKKIPDRTKLQDGDEVGLGGMNVNGRRQEQAAYFLVRIGQCM
ncbi:MAG: FHA domain-containing protein [Lachnospiraceae bacterium]|nr:FHA domain-containing protein [Lachnospiraceae bacterium]